MDHPKFTFFPTTVVVYRTLKAVNRLWFDWKESLGVVFASVFVCVCVKRKRVIEEIKYTFHKCEPPMKIFWNNIYYLWVLQNIWPRECPLCGVLMGSIWSIYALRERETANKTLLIIFVLCSFHTTNDDLHVLITNFVIVVSCISLFFGFTS